ncbi:hypothetical protein A0H81_00549 [Grifola frondosa]|uniref:Uncharacterized protein n=1 Tax=Grifola frondosa TaxID=5627 RepID=A0A1C7MTC1_GRIFR|nr:hypothetical protein A0H81_00549 [Grifola frondosa]
MDFYQYPHYSEPVRLTSGIFLAGLLARWLLRCLRLIWEKLAENDHRLTKQITPTGRLIDDLDVSPTVTLTIS